MAELKPMPPEEGVNVNVILRCRPANAQEIAERASQVIQCHEALREVTLYQSVGGKQMSRTFRYDKVFGPDSKQERVYKQAIVPIVQEVLDGFNCTIFAYGQTGTGKTFTMEGGPRNSVDGSNLSAEAGVIPRAIKQIFDAIECNQVTDSSVKVSFMELYNEELTDLLSPGDDKDKRLRLLEDRSGVVVQGLEEMVVKNAAEIYQVLDRGTSKRRTAETLLNKRSSRSHSVFTITIHMKETTPEGEDVIKIGKLNLVDLAGSENISRSGAKDNRAREAGNINQSLLTLGRVITALVEHSGHVPYRDSKLTRLLRDSLGGKTKTCIIATIAPSVVCLEETISTLDYAYRAKNIRNRPELNQRISKTTMIKELTTEIERLKLDLVATREKNGIFISTERYEASELERAQLREAVLKHKAEVEVLANEHMEELNALTAAHEAEVAATRRQNSELQRQLAEAAAQLQDAQVTIQEGRFVILSHQRAEQAIAAHATQLTSDLGETASELGEVFGRLSAALQLQEGDRQALGSICELAGSKLGKLQAALAAAASAQGGMLQEMRSQVDQFQLRKEKELASLKSQLAQMQASIASTEQLLSAALEEQAAAASAALGSAQQSQAAAAQEMRAAMQSSAAAMAAALAALSSSLQAQGEQLAGFAREQQAAVQAAQQLAAAGFGRARSSVSGIGSSVQELGQLSEATAAAASDSLAAFAAEFEDSMVAKQEQLLAQVGSLLAGFVAERRQAVAGIVAGVNKRLGEGRQQLAAATGEITAAADSCISSLQADAAACEQESQAMQARLGSSLQRATGELAASRSSVAALAAELDQHKQDACGRLQQQVQALSTHVDGSASQITASAAAAQQQLQAATQELQGSSRAIAAAADEEHAADAALAHGLSAAAADAGKQVSAAATQQAGALDDVVGAISSSTRSRLGKQPPSLPQQKRLEVPEAELVAQLCCPPELVLLEHFRMQRAQILERGGDPVEVFGLLAPEPAGKDGRQLPTEQPDSDEQTENEAPALPDSPASSVRSAVSAAGGKRSKIPTLGTAGAANAAVRAGLADRTNL